ncbi:SoxR reducing system RseC family protein [Megasphaera sp.]|uniref:SoxR reducing system RseC family protein n=1 Tax=Megasphaera sp. TaxID=2023260 RepID=UPI0025D7E625|nr:SoxR reducing system RseC family protein [uncultured Megasphaera sp.]
MRTGTGVVEEAFPNGLAKIQTNRNNLYSPCSDSMCADNVVIDAVNPIGAKKGQYVQFDIPETGMGVKGIICFGVPLLLVIICGIIGYLIGSSAQMTPEMTAFAGMIVGGVIGCLILKGYEKKINSNQTKVEITGIIS